MQVKRITLPEYGLAAGLFNKYRMFYDQPDDRQRAENFIKERLENNESVIFVALDNAGNAAGFTQLYPLMSSVRAVRNWVLNDLYVDASYRKQGVGESLVKAAMNFAKQAGAKYIQLETAADNHTAQSLYHTIGFEKQSHSDDYFVYQKELI